MMLLLDFIPAQEVSMLAQMTKKMSSSYGVGFRSDAEKDKVDWNDSFLLICPGALVVS